MTTREIISAIEVKHEEDGIIVNPPASVLEIDAFEKQVGFLLPNDFKEFYLICNGFECTEDIFNIIPLQEIIRGKDYGNNWFHFAEHMIFSDMWSLRKRADGSYEIYNGIGDDEVILTSSLQTFLQIFLQGNVFRKGGLYDWHKEKEKG